MIYNVAMARYYFAFIFIVLFFYHQDLSACEVVNLSEIQGEEFYYAELCKVSEDFLVKEKIIKAGELEYLDLVIEITYADGVKMNMILQLWDGRLLKQSVRATDYYGSFGVDLVGGTY